MFASNPNQAPPPHFSQMQFVSLPHLQGVFLGGGCCGNSLVLLSDSCRRSRVETNNAGFFASVLDTRYSDNRRELPSKDQFRDVGGGEFVPKKRFVFPLDIRTDKVYTITNNHCFPFA